MSISFSADTFLKKVHPEWLPILKLALSEMDPAYLSDLAQHQSWLPGAQNLFAAFSQPLSKTSIILLGESPYPRAQSANGYAFWDAAVGPLWSGTGLSKTVNRATSLRNFIKMLLIARGDLKEDCSQPAIAALNKSIYHQTGSELFQGLLAHGFLLLNACLVYKPNRVPYHAKQWLPFMRKFFLELKRHKPEITVLLFGKVAANIPEVRQFTCVTAPHPYNVSFIHHPDVLTFFAPLDILHV